MDDDVTALWAEDATFEDLADGDLTSSRVTYTRVSDPDHELHQLVETVRQVYDLETRSEAGDMALRIESAYAIDNNLAGIDRREHDIAYTIPPASWIEMQMFRQRELLNMEDVVVEDYRIGVTTSPIVHELATDMVEEGAYPTLSEMVMDGCRRLLGRT